MSNNQSEFCRPCPSCGKILYYSSKGNLTVANKSNTSCKKCMANIRDFNGKNNPFYGRQHSDETKNKLKLVDKSYTQTEEFKNHASHASSKRKDLRWFYDRWVDDYGKDYADTKLVEVKIKQSIANSGINNPMYGKPPTKGVGSGWSGWYNGWFFRSLLELSYVIGTLELNNIKWDSAEKSFLGMPYKDIYGNDKMYFADFIVNDYLLVEIKPKRLINSPKVLAKKKAAELFISNNSNFNYQIITPEYLKHETIISLYKSGTIILTDKTEKQFTKYHNLI